MSRASTKATIAVLGRLHATRSGPAAADLLAYAHDPALGLDRSVCLRDVIERFGECADVFVPELGRLGLGESIREFLTREFGGVSGPSDRAKQIVRILPGKPREALRMAHDPALGLDRSVCLRDVVNALDQLHDDVTIQSRGVERAKRLLIQRYAEVT